MNRIALSIVLAVAGLSSFAQAASFAFRHGPLELTFDEATGALTRIALTKEVLAEAGPDRSPTSFGFGDKGAQTWLEQLKPGRQLVHRRQPAPDTLEVTVRVGDFELIERYKLFTDPPRLDRSATLTNHGKETVKLRAFTFRTPGLRATPDGFYRFPCQWPPKSHPFAEMKAGQSRSGGLSTAPLVAQLAPNRSLLWASCTDDSPHIRVEERREGEAPAEPRRPAPPRPKDGSAGASPSHFDVVQGVGAAGYLRPGQPQEIGFVSMFLAEAGYWEALPKLWDWMDSVGIKVPADRPEWLKGAVLYSFHPGGTIGSNFTNLGGFKAATEYLLPTLPKLGVTAIWIMPVEWKGPYWPLDYYRLQDGLGTADELRALVRRAHELGLKVLMDIVPHGGAPQAVHNQAHPEFMLRREDGTTLTYWLNDFARPDWQDFIARVAEHYIREFDADGFRIDACYGSHELNWDPKVPYARASLSGLAGGLGMTKRIRDVVRKLKPKDGAVLAEVESVRHAAVSDFQYDFNLCYNVLHAWRRMPAAEFVPLLQDYLEEQKYVYPRGTLFLRHVESHDSLRAQGWYGVEGMRALYALSAWIDGVPLIYHGMEAGHFRYLREINECRRVIYERAPDTRGSGLAAYRRARLDSPGVLCWLANARGLPGPIAINLGRERAAGKVRWELNDDEMALEHGEDWKTLPAQFIPELRTQEREIGFEPLGHSLKPPVPIQHLWSLSEPKPRKPVTHLVESDSAVLPCLDQAWFVDTIEGRLEGYCVRNQQRPIAHSSIYWRPQDRQVLWTHETLPLHPDSQRLGAVAPDDLLRFRFLELDAPEKSNPRRITLRQEAAGLLVTGLAGAWAWMTKTDTWPKEPSREMEWTPKEPALRVIGPDYIVKTGHFTCVLRRQGGVIRELFVGDKVVAKEHDLYGDQEYFQLRETNRIAAGNDVESGIRTWTADDGLHLAFEGQLRGFGRFDLKRPPLWYRNEYVFTDAPRFRQKWAFRTEKNFKDRTAFLAAIVQLPEADRFRFLRSSLPKAPDHPQPLPKVSDLREGIARVFAEGEVGEGGERRGQTKGDPPPDRIEFLAAGKPQFSLTHLKAPQGCAPNVFVHGRRFFVTLLDGRGAAMDEGKWHEFEAEWEMGGER